MKGNAFAVAWDFAKLANRKFAARFTAGMRRQSNLLG
jgi:hypothetical protein